MYVEFLGTGGAITTPRPGCNCTVCREARHKGVPYSRTGPSLFVHGPDILIDTPEEIKRQLNRAGIRHVPHCFYSHWHPDHTMGRRVWEMNYDWQQWPPQHRITDVYLPQQVAVDFRERLGAWEHLQYLQEQGVVRLSVLEDGETIAFGETQVYPFRLAQSYVYAFLFTQEETRVLIAPDELLGWSPPPLVQGVDLAIMPMGILEFDPFSGERRIPADHFILETEATFRQTLDMVREMEARAVIMTHVEEMSRLGYDDLLRLEERLKEDEFNVRFAYDTMMVAL